MNNPKEIVKSFITDYKSWNDNAYSMSENDNEKAMKFAEDTYKEFISKYCSSTVIPQGVAFGSDSSHSLETEEITSIQDNDASAIVNTKQTDLFGFISVHEYHLIKEKDFWKISSLLYVDGNDKYECL